MDNVDFIVDLCKEFDVSLVFGCKWVDNQYKTFISINHIEFSASDILPMEPYKRFFVGFCLFKSREPDSWKKTILVKIYGKK